MFLRQNQLEQVIARSDTVYGLLIALVIMGLWAISLVGLLSVNVHHLPIGLKLLAIVWQAFLYTGLFITAHDAMHGSAFPQNPKINHLIGSIAALLHVFFSYQQLLRKHWQHHHHPASSLDPDFHDGQHANGILWYWHFMKQYWSWKRLIFLSITFHLAQYLFHVPQSNLILFWIIPAILSPVQLFFFGTFLPHREPANGYTDPHRATTLSLPAFWSFLTCYHFSYHEEHHEFPHVPWWQLPIVHPQKNLTAALEDI
jgi:beta-carotene ketolase (CrtW type)